MADRSTGGPNVAFSTSCPRRLHKTHPQLLQLLPSELRSNAIEKTESLLVKLVRANFNTKYASNAPLLAEFQDAVSTHGFASVVNDFRRCVPLSDYEAYKPFMVVFDASTCKEAEVENLFAPGIPCILAISSSTSGKDPKIFAKYSSLFPPVSFDGKAAMIFFYGYRELKYVEREPGQIVKKIFVSNGSSGGLRLMQGWTNVDDDDGRMSVIASGLVAPFAASMIANHKSFLMIHALFTLACRDTDSIFLTFSTLFYDFLQFLDEKWDMFLSPIKNGIVPDLPGVGEVYSHLQVSFHANPERAAELGEIGPPSSCEGWAARVWPRLEMVRLACSGPFASVLPKIKSIIGPTIVIDPVGYVSSENHIGEPYQQDDVHTFVLQSSNLIEFLDVTAEESHACLLQAWELEVGKQYEVVVTTSDGLWRYRLGDIIEVMGFDPSNGPPVFMLSGRKSLSIRLAAVLIPDSDIISSIRALSPDVIHVNEFTTLLDFRRSPETIGYLIEPAGALCPNAHLASLRLSDGLATANNEFGTVLRDEEVRNPTVRILGPGTFTAFRQWKAERMNIGPGQVKVPVVLLDEAAKKWILERVVEEL